MPKPPLRRHVWPMVLVVLAVSVLVGSAAGAQTTTEPPAPGGGAESEPADEGEEGEGTGVRGVLRAESQPVAGVTIIVTDPDGQEAGVADSDAEGMWFVPLSTPGEYTVTLDAETLPTGVTLRDPDRNPLRLPVQGGRARAALFGLVGPGGSGDGGVSGGGTDRDAEGSSASGAERSSRGSPTLTRRVAVRLVDGVVFGLILAVAAIGLSLIFGTTKLVNFAHGELVTLGAITAWFLSSEGPRLPVVLAGLVAVVVGAAAGAAAETGIWRPLRARRTGQFQVLVISIGLSLVLRQVLLIWFKAGDRRFRQYGIQREALIDVGALRLNGRDVGLIVVCVVVLVAVALMLQRTKVGKALRAVSDNPDLAASSGINVRRVILFVWILGGALAAGGGVLQGVATRVDYLMGFQLLLLMFAGVILGGLGTAYGAMVGSLVVGLATELSTLWISSELKTVAALVVLVLVLLVRPQGLLGSRDRVG